MARNHQHLRKLLLQAQRECERDLAGIRQAIRALGYRAGRLLPANVLQMPKRRTLSASARRKIGAAQRARWAKYHARNKAA